ncbi:hypothetical protein [Bacillus massiliigorillae]|uniref:hypothetical protein n=1 Tax=Bacillus massiliigorillae TaxID=1243664 RepID=UPI0003A209A6|nr:hypothetical protein [Bacillus massiliigorillae]
MKIFIGIICASLSLALLSGCSEKDNALQKGLDLLKEKKYSEATAYFEDAAHDKEDKQTANLYIKQTELIIQAKQATNSGDYDKATSLLETVKNMKDINLDYVNVDLTDMEAQIKKGKNELSYQQELDTIRTLIADKEFETAESKLDTLKNLIEPNSNMSKKIDEVANLLIEKKDAAQVTAIKNTEQQETVTNTDSRRTDTDTYTSYRNTRFGFSFKYPSYLSTMGEAPTNNDGRRFSNGELEITASAGHINLLEENETIQTYYNRALSDISAPIAYQKVSGNWYVVSYESNGIITYQKGIFANDAINTLVIKYPTNGKEKYDEVVTDVANSFLPGRGYDN